MSTLHDRLADLADDAPPGGPEPGLWDRGRRLHRRRTGGTAVIVATTLIALAVVLMASWSRASYDVQPAEPTGAPALPDQLWNASPWLPGTEETGPLGRLSAVVGSERRSWTGSSNGLAGVSTTGEYAFLDLPDLAATADDIAVSPDGRYVGYWLTGETEGDPNRFDSAVPVVGVAVYDSTTGEVRRHEIATEHGLNQDDLIWAGQTLLAGYSQWDEATAAGDDSSSSSDATRLAWDVDGGTVEEVSRRASLTYATGWREGLVGTDGRSLDLVDVAAATTRLGRFDTLVESTVALDPSGGRVAALEDPDAPGVERSQPKALLVGVVGGDGAIATRRVPGVKAYAVLAWRDDDHVVVLRGGADPGYDSIDVRSGTAERLVVPPQVNWTPGTLVAQEAWQAPTFAAPEPPSPLDPRLTTALVLGAALSGLLVLIGWRRRVRA